jgi:HAD superfamily hydrolase (TIGR01509 family)
MNDLEPWPIDGVVFDMDGLLLDTESLAMRSLANAAGDWGVNAPTSFHHAMIGLSADGCCELLRGRFGPGFYAEAYLASANRHLERLVETGQLRLKSGVLALLAHLEHLGLPKAVATSSSRFKAARHLQAVDIFDRFEVIITRDDVARGKPHPDLFLLAMKELGLPPRRCLVLEDSYNGVRAASAAGATVIMVPDLLPATEEMHSLCAMVVTDLNAILRLAPLQFPRCSDELLLGSATAKSNAH